MKRYLIAINVFEDKDYAGTPQQAARPMLEFGRKAISQGWQNVKDFIKENHLCDEVLFCSRPAWAPFLYISCTENAARQIQEAGLGNVNNVLEMTLPFEAPEWHKGLRLLEP